MPNRSIERLRWQAKRFSTGLQTPGPSPQVFSSWLELLHLLKMASFCNLGENQIFDSARRMSFLKALTFPSLTVNPRSPLPRSVCFMGVTPSVRPELNPGAEAVDRGGLCLWRMVGATPPPTNRAPSKRKPSPGSGGSPFTTGLRNRKWVLRHFSFSKPTGIVKMMCVCVVFTSCAPDPDLGLPLKYSVICVKTKEMWTISQRLPRVVTVR